MNAAPTAARFHRGRFNVSAGLLAGWLLASATFDFSNLSWVKFGELKIWSAAPIRPLGHPEPTRMVALSGRKVPSP